MATPGNGISGSQGDVLLNTTQVSEITKWSFNPKIESKAYTSNKTLGAKKRIKSNKDGSGSIEGIWDPYDPITDHLEEGTEVSLKLQHATGQFWLVPAMVESLTFDVDIDSGDVEKWTADFSTTGVWTKPVALTATTPAPFLAGTPEAHEAARLEQVQQQEQSQQQQQQEQAAQPQAAMPKTRMAQAQHQAAPGMAPEQMQALAQAIATALAQQGQVFHQQGSGQAA